MDSAINIGGAEGASVGGAFKSAIEKVSGEGASEKAQVKSSKNKGSSGSEKRAKTRSEIDARIQDVVSRIQEVSQRKISSRAKFRTETGKNKQNDQAGKSKVQDGSNKDKQGNSEQKAGGALVSLGYSQIAAAAGTGGSSAAVGKRNVAAGNQKVNQGGRLISEGSNLDKNGNAQIKSAVKNQAKAKAQNTATEGGLRGQASQLRNVQGNLQSQKSELSGATNSQGLVGSAKNIGGAVGKGMAQGELQKETGIGGNAAGLALDGAGTMLDPATALDGQKMADGFAKSTGQDMATGALQEQGLGGASNKVSGIAMNSIDPMNSDTRGALGAVNDAGLAIGEDQADSAIAGAIGGKKQMAGMARAFGENAIGVNYTENPINSMRNSRESGLGQSNKKASA